MIEAPGTEASEWFAIKTRTEFKAESVLSELCDEVFLPKHTVLGPLKKKRIRPVIPRVLFIRTSLTNALHLEEHSRTHPHETVPFWLYRFPDSKIPQVIPQRSLDLLRLLTSDDTSDCKIYTAKEFHPGQRVRVIDGIFKGHEGYVKRIAKNRHVIVNIEGVCMVILPFIHPDLLEPIDDDE